MVHPADLGTSVATTKQGTFTSSAYAYINDLISDMEIYDIPEVNHNPSYFYIKPGIYRPVIIPGATIRKDSFKDKIKAKYIRAGPKIYI